VASLLIVVSARFGSVVRTDTQTDRQTRMNAKLSTGYIDIYIYIYTVSQNTATFLFFRITLSNVDRFK